MHDPREEHKHTLKRIVRYIQGTLDHGLHLYHSSAFTLISYTYADWGECPDTHRSTSSYCVFFLGYNLVSWAAKRQATLSHSSAKAEYHGVLMLSLNLDGYVISFLSSIVLCRKLL